MKSICNFLISFALVFAIFTIGKFSDLNATRIILATACILAFGIHCMILVWHPLYDSWLHRAEESSK